MKTIIKLLIVALIVNAGYRYGRSYYDHQNFQRDVHAEILHGTFDTSDVLKQHILTMAATRDYTMTADDIHVSMDHDLITVDLKWVHNVELVPRVYTRPFPYDGHAQVRRTKPMKLIP